DVLVDALGLMAVGPSDDDVLRMAFMQALPFLVAEHVEVQRVEDLEVALDSGRLALVLRGGGGRILGERFSAGCNSYKRQGGGRSEDVAGEVVHGVSSLKCGVTAWRSRL